MSETDAARTPALDSRRARREAAARHEAALRQEAALGELARRTSAPLSVESPVVTVRPEAPALDARFVPPAPAVRTPTPATSVVGSVAVGGPEAAVRHVGPAARTATTQSVRQAAETEPEPRTVRLPHVAADPAPAVRASAVGTAPAVPGRTQTVTFAPVVADSVPASQVSAGRESAPSTSASQRTPAEPLPTRHARRRAARSAGRPARASRAITRAAAPGASFMRRARSGTDLPRRWAARAGVLGSLAVATIVMPIASGAGDVAGELFSADTVSVSTLAAGPSTLDVLTADRTLEDVTTIIAEGDPLSGRNLQLASRGVGRDALPECDLSVTTTSGNGLLTAGELCDLWSPGQRLQPAAAVSLTALNDAFRARFGTDICLTDSYRPLSSQRTLAVTKPGLAAIPGRSMHGWGLAVDMCGSSYGTAEVWNWLKANGPIYGWDNPAWARRGGAGAYEPWHWEYTAGVEAVSASTYGY